MKLYKSYAAISLFIFFLVGILFLFFPSQVLIFFNYLSEYFGFQQTPLALSVFYPALAGSYMCLVTILAGKMYRHPEERIYPLLLFQGKAASSLFSLYLFIVQGLPLICLINFLVDGCVALSLLFLIAYQKRAVLEQNAAAKSNPDSKENLYDA